MGKYTSLQTDVFSVFGSSGWLLENIKTYPVNFVATVPGSEFIRVSIIPSGAGLNLKSVSGILIISIFIPAGNGPNRASLIADRLDLYLVGKTFQTLSSVTQLKNSSLTLMGLDIANPSLYRADYTIPFNYFGVQ